jgi:hypothetical protein
MRPSRKPFFLPDSPNETNLPIRIIIAARIGAPLSSVAAPDDRALPA